MDFPLCRPYSLLPISTTLTPPSPPYRPPRPGVPGAIRVEVNQFVPLSFIEKKGEERVGARRKEKKACGKEEKRDVVRVPSGAGEKD